MPTIDIFLNVTAPPFNAAGDGTTDDTVAIQNAINASVASFNYQRVEFPRGVYVISATLFLPTGVSIEGNGATIQRKTGNKTAFDMLVNDDPTNGNENLTIKNLIIDGTRQVDSLDPGVDAERFAGLKLENVINSYVENVTIINTVNGEIQPPGQKTTGGLYVYKSQDIKCVRVNGYGNDRTAIFIYDSSRIIIQGSITSNNAGSGITSALAHECEYHDILSYNNGVNPTTARYTNVSINGLRCKASNITSFGATGSGVNLGHSDGFPADFTIISSIHSYNNELEGITITNSIGVSVLGAYLSGNLRNNLRVFQDSSHTRLSHIIAKESKGEGILFNGGKGHVLDNSVIYLNSYTGITIEQDAEVTIGLGVEVYNNSQFVGANTAGLLIDRAQNCRVFGLSAFDDQVTKTQKGVWIAGVGSPTVRANQINFDWGIKNNATFNIQQSSVVNLQLDNQILHDGNEFHSITPTSPWTVSSGAGYWLDRNGFVHLLGVFNNGTTGTTCFTLPIGFRPSVPMQFSTPGNNAYSNTVVDTNGNIILYTSNVNHYIDGICFKAVI